MSTEQEVHAVLRQRLLARAGLLDSPAMAPYAGWTFDQVRSASCLDSGFVEKMDARLCMGLLRYGAIAPKLRQFERLEKAVSKLELYRASGNTEFLVDAANYCRLEFETPSHAAPFFESHDRR